MVFDMQSCWTTSYASDVHWSFVGVYLEVSQAEYEVVCDTIDLFQELSILIWGV